MSFDPIIFAALNKLKPIVGSMEQVPSNFSSPDYLDAGSQYDPAEYPDLADVLSTGFNADKFVERTIPAFPSCYSTVGILVRVAFSNGGNYYVVNSAGQVYKTTGTDWSTLAFYKQLTLPASYTSLVNVSVQNNRLYVTTAGTVAAYYFDLTDATLSTVTTVTMPTASSGWKFKYANGLYLAINSSVAGTSIAGSDDGVTFTSRTATYTATYTPQGIEYGNGLWVIVTTGTSTNNVSTSPDGTTWTARSVGTVGHKSIKFSSALTLFVTSANTAAGAFYSSPDGITWTSRAQGTATGSVILADLNVTDSGTFVTASLNSSTSSIQVSTNGTTWVNRANVAPLTNAQGNSLATAQQTLVVGDTILVFGQSGSNSQLCYTTTADVVTLGTIKAMPATTNTTSVRAPVFITGNQVGLAMEVHPSVNTTFFQGLAWNGIRTTDGGSTWSQIAITPPQPMQFFGLVATPSRFFVYGEVSHLSGPNTAGNNFISGTSTDGVTWTWNVTANPSMITAAAANDVLLAASGSALATYYTSTDFGVTWTSRTAPITTFSLRAHESNFILFNTGGTSYVSTNGGTSFVAMGAPTVASSTLGGFASSPGIAFYALNNSTAGYVSYDGGSTWSSRTLPANMTSAGAIQIANGWIMVHTGTGYIMRSNDDGLTWDTVKIGLDDAYVFQWYWQSTSTDGTKAYLGGLRTGTTGYYLESSDAHYSIPMAVSAVSGTKWVVKAKK